jgi:Zn-finger nucleic acid-binding protein
VNCPACKLPLIVLEFMEIEIDYCPSCAGSWFDEGELELILGRSEVLPAEGDFLKGRRGMRPCPHCHRKMNVGSFPGTAVEVDVCASGHGIWMDSGELLAITRASTGAEDAGKLAAFCKSVFEEDKK